MTNRRSFLKQLGVLATTLVVPELKAEPKILLGSFNPKTHKPYELIGVDKPFVNHMVIQRKTYTTTGGSPEEALYFNFADKPPVWLNEPKTEEDYRGLIF